MAWQHTYLDFSEDGNGLGGHRQVPDLKGRIETSVPVKRSYGYQEEGNSLSTCCPGG
jgi:hypothetical protein